MKSQHKENLNRDLNLYAMSKQNLIKKVQILMHELAIHNSYQQSRKKLEGVDLQTIHKQLIEKDIIISQLMKNENTYASTFKAKQGKINELQAQLKIKEEINLGLKKQNQVLNKRIRLNQKIKQKQSNERIETLSKQTRERIESLQEQNKKLKKSHKEQNNKVKILSELNQQTQQKLANALISKTAKIQQVNISINNKQNLDTNAGNLKLENYSLKQTIRSLREELRTCQQSKQILKTKFHEKQLLYSRMMSLRQS